LAKGRCVRAETQGQELFGLIAIFSETRLPLFWIVLLANLSGSLAAPADFAACDAPPAVEGGKICARFVAPINMAPTAMPLPDATRSDL
jgi:hypothetical protein